MAEGSWGDLEGEVWRAVRGTWGRYEVSTMGRVRSRFKSQWVRQRSRRGDPPAPPWRILKPSVNPRTGYLAVQLGRRNSVYVQVLVLETFVRPRPDRQQARHLNGVRSDNRLANLKWGTLAQQHQDRQRHGTARLPSPGADNRGTRNGRARLTDEAVLWIRSCGLPTREIMARLGIADTTVRNIRNGYRWKHLQASSKGLSQKASEGEAGAGGAVGDTTTRA